jgi:hypothetical protein
MFRAGDFCVDRRTEPNTLPLAHVHGVITLYEVSIKHAHLLYSNLISQSDTTMVQHYLVPNISLP